MTIEQVSALAWLIQQWKEGKVTLPLAPHKYHCNYWRMGRRHGPCICGAEVVQQKVTRALFELGVVDGNGRRIS